MASSNEFIDFLHEVFEDLGPIQAKRMFGGYGIYHDGLMFGLVVMRYGFDKGSIALQELVLHLDDLLLRQDLLGDLRRGEVGVDHLQVHIHLSGGAFLNSSSLNSAQAKPHRFRYQSDLS